jgi:hypothetical protein
VIVVASAVFSGYGWLNTAVSLDYARQQQKTERARSELLRQFVLAFNHGAKRSEIIQFARHNFGKGHVIKEEQDRILVDDIVFRFDNTQLLSKVQFLGEDD